jgi:hypothetical protein
MATVPERTTHNPHDLLLATIQRLQPEGSDQTLGRYVSGFSYGMKQQNIKLTNAPQLPRPLSTFSHYHRVFNRSAYARSGVIHTWSLLGGCFFWKIEHLGLSTPLDHFNNKQ